LEVVSVLLGGRKKIEGATAVKLLRPLSIEPQSFLRFSVQSGVSVELVLRLGKWFLIFSLWKAVDDCSKVAGESCGEHGDVHKTRNGAEVS
jgi:hypothetical protein